MDGVPGPAPMSPARPPGRRWILWIVAPAVLGLVAGVTAAAVPWGRDLLGLALGISGLAWVLRVASDWFAEHAGPQRGVMLLGTILIGTWLVLAILSPAPLRSLGFGPLLVPPPERDPYALPPAGSQTPLQSLQEPAQPIDLKSLVSPSSKPAAPTPPDPETQPPAVPGDRAATITTLSLSSATSVAGEGLVLIALVRGDGRPVRGTIEFETGGQIVARQALRVQGDASQTEYRILGLPPGLHTIRASYLGSRSFEPSRSAAVLHRVAAR
jgi:hypothetical protein